MLVGESALVIHRAGREQFAALETDSGSCSSPGTGGTSGTRAKMRANAAGSARHARSSKYSSVSKAAIFSATAVVG